MKNFIFRCLLATAAITVVGLAIPQTTPAQDATPSWLKPYKSQIWNPQSILLLVVLAGSGYVLMSSSNKKKNRMANARWAGSTEKKAAQRIAFKQLNERRRDGLTTWINTPIIASLKKPQVKNGNLTRRYNINPQASTIFIPDGQRGTAVCGAPGSGKTFSVIDPMVRSVIDQGFPICLYDFKFPGGQAEIHAAYARSRGYDVRIFAPQRRAYGEAHFNLVIKDLKRRNQHSAIDKNGINLRITALEKLLPKQASVKPIDVMQDIFSDVTQELNYLDNPSR
jgi:type IV secretory pathway TraG/TraD family ATPase VirD4